MANPKQSRINAELEDAVTWVLNNASNESVELENAPPGPARDLLEIARTDKKAFYQHIVHRFRSKEQEATVDSIPPADRKRLEQIDKLLKRVSKTVDQEVIRRRKKRQEKQA